MFIFLIHILPILLEEMCVLEFICNSVLLLL